MPIKKQNKYIKGLLLYLTADHFVKGVRQNEWANSRKNIEYL